MADRHERRPSKAATKERDASIEPAANELDADGGRDGSLGESREFDQEKGRRGNRTRARRGASRKVE